MKKILSATLATVAALAIAAPAFACGMKNQQTVSNPIPTTTAEAPLPMTPIPAQPQG